MNRFGWFIGIALIGSLFFLPLAGAAQQQQKMAAPAKAATMSGKISAIDMAANTVVVEIGKGKQMLTVGGPLAPKATLTKGGQAVKLSDFKMGDQVAVAYKSTEKGPVIYSLSGK